MGAFIRQDGAVVIPKSWRSEYTMVCIFLFSLVESIFLSRNFPWSVIPGELIRVGSIQIWLWLPLASLVPFTVLALALVRIYDVRYIIDQSGIEMQEGILSFSKRVVRIRYEDVRSVETKQPLAHRFLGIGHVEIGTAATSGIEISMDGVAAPLEIQQMIQRERDKRQRRPQKEESVSGQIKRDGGIKDRGIKDLAV